MTPEEYEEKRRRLEADAVDAKKAYIRAKSVYDGICEEMRNLRIDWNEQQRNQTESEAKGELTVSSQAAQVLERAIRALGGTWDTRRSVTALRDTGLGDGELRAQEKSARQALRDLKAAGVIVKVDPNSATYRLVTEE
ncbi:hypothetical protein [Streptomyces halstedii]|uniref:hypothetical protein n=1 Tax=Streptomyces halstedii TaxID=1944 RepID=UPI0038229AC4